MERKTIGLGLIVKNEERNIKRLLMSVIGCFDQVVVTDTGSTDRTVEVIGELNGNEYRYKQIEVNGFNWVNDFSAARNYNKSFIKTDYYMWLDADDYLGNPEAFRSWCKNTMPMADYWIANYNYAFDKNGKSICTFGRERVVKNEDRFKWKYAIHEGIISFDDKPVNGSTVTDWCVNHMRTEEDLAQDKRRNLNIFEELLKEEKLDARLRYYYGKELFENGNPKLAASELLKACSQKELELHDRILGLQYACQSLMVIEEFDKTIQVAHEGLQIAPNRAEFFVMIGDSYLKKGALKEALTYYAAAKKCDPLDQMEDPRHISALFSNKSAYFQYPCNQSSRIYFHLGKLKEAKDEVREAILKSPNEESEMILKEISRIQDETDFSKAIDCNDIVFTCLGGLYEWDYNVYKNKGIGGSETACVEMAHWFKKLMPSRNVIVFNPRQEDTVIDGVQYIRSSEVHKYFKDSKPHLHVAWRHNFKLTDAKTVAWSHDLAMPGIENTDTYHKYLVLSEFHKNYVHSLYKVPLEKIHVTRNGINPERFKNVQRTEKNPNKIVFVSSPDRGLDRAIRVLDLVRETHPVELHVFYGVDNMRKMGLHEKADYYENMCKERPWVKLHGNLPQDQLIQEYQDAAIWLYPTDFLETFCISALETALSGVYPIVRKHGALPDTLSRFSSNGCADVIDVDCSSDSEIDYYASLVKGAINGKKWEKLHYEPNDFSWESVAKEWIKDFID